jgi:hypothetical protein
LEQPTARTIPCLALWRKTLSSTWRLRLPWRWTPFQLPAKVERWIVPLVVPVRQATPERSVWS